MAFEISQPSGQQHFSVEAVAPVVYGAPLRARLAQAILDLAECTEIDVANSIFVTAAISNQSLAALAGGKPKTVARLVEQFKSQGLVEKRRERFIIRAPERLQGIVAKSI